jgi:hypothetical protein
MVETPATDSESTSDWIGVTSRTNSISSASPSSSSLSGCVGVRSEAAERVSTRFCGGNGPQTYGVLILGAYAGLGPRRDNFEE